MRLLAMRILVMATLMSAVVWAAEINIGVEFPYPTEYEQQVSGNVISQMIPRSFKTRMVGVRLNTVAIVGQPAAPELALQPALPEEPRDAMGNTPLITAAAAGDKATVEAWLAHGADVNASNRHGATALMFAAARGDVDLVKLLLQCGARPNEATDYAAHTALIYATSKGHAQVVALLLRHKAEVTWRDASGKIALDYAKKQDRTEIIRLLTNPPSATFVAAPPATSLHATTPAK